MTNTVFLIFRALFITIMTLGMMASLTDFRFGYKKLLCILAIYSVWAFVSSGILLWLGGELLLLRLFFLTLSIPGILLTYWAANDTPAQAVFNYITQIMVSALSASMIRWLTDTLGLSIPVNILLMFGFYGAAIYLEWRFLRQPFRMLLKIMPTRWGVFTLIPCAFCAYLIFVASWPGSYLENSAQRAYVYTAVIPLAFVYIAVYKILLAQYRIQMERQNAALLTVQISALREKMQKVGEVEEKIRIQRHDLRHQLQAATELVARGDQETAISFLSTAAERLDSYKAEHWCRPPILDAVFASYFEQARRHGISVDAKVTLPEPLPVDEGELAIVFSNALENAIHANLELPRQRRKLRCQVISHPGMMLEIVNPFLTAVQFDEKGFPLAGKEGHGLGTQSIRFFCEKHGAICQYEVKDGLFSLRVIL